MVELKYTHGGNRNEQFELMNAEYLAKNRGWAMDGDGKLYKSVSYNGIAHVAYLGEAKNWIEALDIENSLATEDERSQSM